MGEREGEVGLQGKHGRGKGEEEGRGEGEGEVGLLGEEGRRGSIITS